MSRSRICLVLALSCVVLVTSRQAHSETPTSASPTVPAALVQLGTGDYYSPYAFVVDKKSRRLSIWNQKDQRLAEVATFPIDFGRGGGNKKKYGDLNTPEGIYFLMEKLDGPSLDFRQYGARAFTTNYPNLFDEREGKTGNGIWLHAVPDDTPLTRGSRGCVVVRNEVILEVSKYIKLQQTPLVIFNEVPSVPSSERDGLLKRLRDRIESWRTAWESKNIAAYMEYYAGDFESLKMNRQKWQKYKSGLNQEYKSIQVRLSEPVIYRHGERMVVRFLQAYQSDKKADYGEKTLYWRHDGGDWRIVAEQWSSVNNPIAYHDLAPFNGTPEPSTACQDCTDSARDTVTQNRAPTATAAQN